MSDRHDELDSDVRKVLGEIASQTYEEKVLVSGWVLVAEVVTEENGTPALVTAYDSHTPAWDAYGMLMWAADEVSSQSDDDDD